MGILQRRDRLPSNFFAKAHHFHPNLLRVFQFAHVSYVWIRCISRAELTFAQNTPAAFGVLSLRIATCTRSEDSGLAGFEAVYWRGEDEPKFRSSSRKNSCHFGQCIRSESLEFWYDLDLVMVLLRTLMLGVDVGR